MDIYRSRVYIYIYLHSYVESENVVVLTDLTFSLPKKQYVVLQKISSGFPKGSLLLFLFIASVNRHSHLKCNLT